jgi:hypothetical protein
MNTKSIIIVMLIVVGIVVLASLGMSFTTPGKPIAILGLHVAADHSEFIPPVAGALALVGGIGLLLLIKPRTV